MAQGKTIIVLGGGIGGTVAASRLRKMLPNEHRVASIEPEASDVFSLSAEVAGKRAPYVFDGHLECSIEAGGRKAGFGSGDFYAGPVPEMRRRRLSTALHLGELASEKLRLSGEL